MKQLSFLKTFANLISFHSAMPIAMSKDEWSRIVRWTEHGEDPDVVRLREYVRYLDTTSKNMTKDWPNSVEVTFFITINIFIYLCFIYLYFYIFSQCDGQNPEPW